MTRQFALNQIERLRRYRLAKRVLISIAEGNFIVAREPEERARIRTQIESYREQIENIKRMIAELENTLDEPLQRAIM